MNRPRLLDLFCGAGGAAMGYHRAGFDVTGVDIAPQPHYPFKFHRGDAMTWPLDGYDAIHASPPCQAYSAATQMHDRTRHPDLVDAVRDRLAGAGVPYVIENVAGSPLRNWAQVCGSGLGMVRIRRHRWFESNVMLLGVPCAHGQNRRVMSVTGHGENGGDGKVGPGWLTVDRVAAMGIDWMTRDEMSLAIPPAYTEHIGTQLLAYIEVTTYDAPMTDTPTTDPAPVEPDDDDTEPDTDDTDDE
jgi:DNA (cytosine-5)-methyltransferase 1